MQGLHSGRRRGIPSLGWMQWPRRGQVPPAGLWWAPPPAPLVVPGMGRVGTGQRHNQRLFLGREKWSLPLAWLPNMGQAGSLPGQEPRPF